MFYRNRVLFIAIFILMGFAGGAADAQRIGLPTFITTRTLNSNAGYQLVVDPSFLASGATVTINPGVAGTVDPFFLIDKDLQSFAGTWEIVSSSNVAMSVIGGTMINNNNTVVDLSNSGNIGLSISNGGTYLNGGGSNTNIDVIGILAGRTVGVEIGQGGEYLNAISPAGSSVTTISNLGAAMFPSQGIVLDGDGELRNEGGDILVENVGEESSGIVQDSEQSFFLSTGVDSLIRIANRGAGSVGMELSRMENRDDAVLEIANPSGIGVALAGNSTNMELVNEAEIRFVAPSSGLSGTGLRVNSGTEVRTKSGGVMVLDSSSTLETVPLIDVRSGGVASFDVGDQVGGGLSVLQANLGIQIRNGGQLISTASHSLLANTVDGGVAIRNAGSIDIAENEMNGLKSSLTIDDPNNGIGIDNLSGGTISSTGGSTITISEAREIGIRNAGGINNQSGSTFRIIDSGTVAQDLIDIGIQNLSGGVISNEGSGTLLDINLQSDNFIIGNEDRLGVENSGTISNESSAEMNIRVASTGTPEVNVVGIDNINELRNMSGATINITGGASNDTNGKQTTGILNRPGGTFTSMDGATINIETTDGIGVDNQGTMEVSAPVWVDSSGGIALRNTGTLSVTLPRGSIGGLVVFAGSIENQSGGTLVVANNNTFSQPSYALELRGSSSLHNDGTLEIDGLREAILMESQATLINTGSIRFQQSRTNLRLSGQALFESSGRLEGGGTLSSIGNGYHSTGTLSPGIPDSEDDRIDFLQFFGSPLVQEGGTLEIDIRETTSGRSNDSINTSKLKLGQVGSDLVTIDIGLLDGYVPAPGDVFTFLNYGQLEPESGTLDVMELDIADAMLPRALRWELVHEENKFQLHVVREPILLAGDYNGDGTVDLADYTMWRNNLGAPAGTLFNDSAGGVIGNQQYTAWKANFGASLPAAISQENVPEPGTWVILALAAVGTLFRYRCAFSAS